MAVFYENKDKTIMCPNCKKKLTKADSKDPNMHKLKCKKCGKWIWYVPKTDYTEIHTVPKRDQGSGTRFY